MQTYQKVSNADITEKTKLNLIRKSTFIDELSFCADGKTPMFSWIDISLTELCNRLCAFCPRVDPDFYPNQSLHFGNGLGDKIADELRGLNYQGGVVFCGYGEPMLHPQLENILNSFRGIHTEIVTNGDRLTTEKTIQLFEAGLSFLCVSMYDGEHQVEHFESMMKEAGVPKERFILRDRWHTEDDQFGLKLTNRSGALNFGPDPNDFEHHPCFYPSYSIAIDWNGDVLQCVQDWNKKVKYGNVASTDLIDIWKSIKYQKSRMKLIDGDRSSAPCSACNADGCFHGFHHVNEWIKL